MDNNNITLRQKVRNFKVLSFDAMTIIEEEKEKIEAIKIDDDTEIQSELQEIWNYLNTAERCFLDGTRVFELATKRKQKVMDLIPTKNPKTVNNQNDNVITPQIIIDKNIAHNRVHPSFKVCVGSILVFIVQRL